jgi:uncharacterized membrane protein (DUF4010 family)
MPAADLAIRPGLAGLIGLAVGTEREWSGHATGPRARFAGARTFFLLGLLGGISGWLIDSAARPLAIVLLAGGAALATVAYAAATLVTHDADGTTETAALLVLATGALAGLGRGAIASGVAAVAVAALAEKARIQQVVRRIEEKELRAAFHFAVLALVVLPLLPRGPFGPHDAVRPRELWSIVLLFSGLNFLGYAAQRAVGTERGYGVAGLLGGLVSSTAVALTFARRSRSEPERSAALALGIVGACTVLLARMGIVTAVLNGPLAFRLLPYLLPAAVVGTLAVGLILLRRAAPAPDSPIATDRNPLRLGSAIQMAVAFQVMLLVLPTATSRWGAGGLVGSAAVLGLTDMDALTFSLARAAGGTAPLDLAARALAVGVLANTVVKLIVVLAAGAPPLRRLAGSGLLALAAALALSVVPW